MHPYQATTMMEKLSFLKGNAKSLLSILAVTAQILTLSFMGGLIPDALAANIPSANMERTIKIDHPRLWIDAQEKATIIARCADGGDLRDYYLRVKDYVDHESEKTGAAIVHHRYWLSHLLCAMVEGEPYVSEVKTQIATWYANRMTVRYNDYQMSSIAFCYDWLFDELDETDKTRVAGIFKEWWAYWNSVSAYVHASWNNHTMEEIHGYVFGALALYGDGYCDTEAAYNLTKASEWLFNELIPATDMSALSTDSDGIGGGWAEGADYWVRGAYGLMCMINAWSTATNENILDDVPAIKHLAQWVLHITRNDGTRARFSDVAAHTSTLTGSSNSSIMMYMLSDMYNDPHARYLWNKRVPPAGELSPESLSRSYSYVYTFYIVFNNDTVPLDIEEEGRVAFFDAMDMVTIHESFDEGDTFFLYKNNDMYDGHDHFDAGHFEIARDAGLAIDSGAYEGGNASPESHAWKYYQRTIAHNTITVFDPDENWGGSGNELTNNDGGQKWPGAQSTNEWGHHPQRAADIYPGSVYDRGEVAIFDSNDEYTYFKADITPAYARGDGSDFATTGSRKMALCNREVAYLANNYFVIFDKVKSTNADFLKRWLLHSVNEPIVNPDDTIHLDNGLSRLYVHPLLPEVREITKRGGPGYEYWTTYDGSGENPTFSQYHGRPPNEPGAWRLEISPKGANEEDCFLHVLFPTDQSTPMPDVVRIDGNNVRGVFIDDATENQIMLFNARFSDLSISGSITYSVITTTGSRHVISGLNPDTRYLIDISGDSFSGMSNSKGVLMFVGETAGERIYTITDSATPHNGCDLTGDGIVNIQDVIVCVNAIIDDSNADVNGDGVTNIVDAIYIVNKILGN